MAATAYRSRLLRYRGGSYRYRGAVADIVIAEPIEDGVLGYGATIILYTAGGLKVAEFSSTARESRLEKCTFDLLPTGPGQISLDMRSLPTGITIPHIYRVDVHLYGRSRPIYSGMVQKRPGDGSTKWPAEYDGFGFIKCLDHLLVSGTYTAQSVSRVVDILARDLESRAPIVYNGSKIIRNTNSKYPLQEIRFNKTPLKRALEQLSGLAGGFEFGVDADREFFFRPPETSIADDSVFFVGKHLDKYEPEEDSSEVRNRIWIKYGKLAVGTGDNYLADPLEDLASQALYGVRETTLSAPSVYSEADAYRWGAVQLARLKDPVERTVIANPALRTASMDCRGYVRVHDGNGIAHELPKKKIGYVLDGSGITASAQVGEAERNAGTLAAELQQVQQIAELLQQIANSQLA